jgi:hypothetical protein
MNALHRHTQRRAACALLGAATLLMCASSGASASAQARPSIRLTSPGQMVVPDVPAQVKGGEHVTLIEKMPIYVIDGRVLMQRETPAGTWKTAASAKLFPWVLWLHWAVPHNWSGQQLTVRFLLKSGKQLLAASPTYPIAVSLEQPLSTKR